MKRFILQKKRNQKFHHLQKKEIQTSLKLLQLPQSKVINNLQGQPQKVIIFLYHLNMLVLDQMVATELLPYHQVPHGKYL